MVGGWWLVVSGWWLVVGGWWLVKFNAMARRRNGAMGWKDGAIFAAPPYSSLFGLGVCEFARRSFEQADDGYADYFVSRFVVADDYAVSEVDAEGGFGGVYGDVEDVGFFVVAAF